MLQRLEGPCGKGIVAVPQASATKEDIGGGAAAEVVAVVGSDLAVLCTR